MRIRYVYDQLLPSRDTDTEQVLNTVSALGRRGVEVTLVIPVRPGAVPVGVDALRDYYQVRGPFSVEHELAPLARPRPLQKALHGLRASRTSAGADLVYTRNLHAVAFALRAGQRVAYEHFRPWADQYPPLEPVLRWMVRHENFLGAILHSSHIASSYLRVGLPPERMLVAHNGFDPERMEPRLDRLDARARLDLPRERPLAVYAGRVHERKGLLSVLDLARSVPEVTFVLVGSEAEGRVEREARALENVIVRPWQRFDATVAYLYAADVLLIPPTLSPLKDHGTTVLPMKLFQYLVSGRPIFAPFAPDTAELLIDDETAVLVAPGDLAAQAAALRSLISDEPRRTRIAGEASARAATWTWDARAEKLERFLRQRLGAQAPSPVANAASDSWSAFGWARSTSRWLGEKATKR